MKFKDIQLDHIIEGENVRLEEDDLGELMNSIEMYDVIQPVLVVPAADPGKYLLVSGHRRFKAMKYRNEATIPCIIRDDLGKDDIPFIRLVENVQRKQLSPFELVTFFDEVLQHPGMTRRQLAHLLGKSETWICNKYRASRVYGALLNRGIPPEEVNELTEWDLLNLSKLDGVNDQKDIMNEAKKRKQPISKMVDGIKGPDLKHRGTYRDDSGGFTILSAGKKITIVCQDEETSKRLVKALLKLKVKFMDELIEASR